MFVTEEDVPSPEVLWVVGDAALGGALAAGAAAGVPAGARAPRPIPPPPVGPSLPLLPPEVFTPGAPSGEVSPFPPSPFAWTVKAPFPLPPLRLLRSPDFCDSTSTTLLLGFL